MGMHTECEPKPREVAGHWSPSPFQASHSVPLSREIEALTASFAEVLRNRQSLVGGALAESSVSAVLWYSMLLRYREQQGRFGVPYESRTAPSPGGLHPISVFCIPVGSESLLGLYDADKHELLKNDQHKQAMAGNTMSIKELVGATSGVTLQFVADTSKIAAFYQNWESLLWREAGCLSATISLVATALDVRSVLLGRLGTDLLRAAGIDAPFVGVGGVHISAKDR